MSKTVDIIMALVNKIQAQQKDYTLLLEQHLKIEEDYHRLKEDYERVKEDLDNASKDQASKIVAIKQKYASELSEIQNRNSEYLQRIRQLEDALGKEQNIQ